jgi:hypothetical protein
VQQDDSRRGPTAATAQVAHEGVLLLVGIGGRLVVVCAAAAMDSGLRHVAVARVEEAVARMAELAPRVIVVPGTMAREEHESLARAAALVDAEIVDLPAVTAPPVVSHDVARALAIAESRRATSEAAGPTTQRAAR